MMFFQWLIVPFICLFGAVTSLQIQPNAEIIFPVEAPEIASRNFVVKDRPNCSMVNGRGDICDEDKEYDIDVETRFEEAVKKAHIDGQLMKGIFADLLQGDQIPTKVSTRFQGLISEDPVCPAKEKIIYPKRGVTKQDEWVFLLNQGTMQQGIRVEECFRENERCSVGLSSDEDTICRQKYIFKKLLAMDRHGTTVAPESILVPSCCVCYKRTILPRFGFTSVSSPAQSPTDVDTSTVPTSNMVAATSVPDKEIIFHNEIASADEFSSVTDGENAPAGP